MQLTLLLDSNPELTSDTAPGEPELLSRQDAFPVDVPREPNNVVKAAAREGHPVIHDGDSQGGQCWILHDDKGDCVKRFAEVKDFDMTIWGDCYKIEQCPKKRDALPEWPLADRDALHEPGRFGERDGAGKFDSLLAFFRLDPNYYLFYTFCRAFAPPPIVLSCLCPQSCQERRSRHTKAGNG